MILYSYIGQVNIINKRYSAVKSKVLEEYMRNNSIILTSDYNKNNLFEIGLIKINK